MRDVTTKAEHLKLARSDIAAGTASFRSAADHIASAIEMGATQAEAAVAVGISQSTVSRLLKWRTGGFKGTSPFDASNAKAKAKKAKAKDDDVHQDDAHPEEDNDDADNDADTEPEQERKAAARGGGGQNDEDKPARKKPEAAGDRARTQSANILDAIREMEKLLDDEETLDFEPTYKTRDCDTFYNLIGAYRAFGDILIEHGIAKKKLVVAVMQNIDAKSEVAVMQKFAAQKKEAEKDEGEHREKQTVPLPKKVKLNGKDFDVLSPAAQEQIAKARPIDTVQSGND
jgi:hypothetical protein